MSAGPEATNIALVHGGFVDGSGWQGVWAHGTSRSRMTRARPGRLDYAEALAAVVFLSGITFAFIEAPALGWASRPDPAGASGQYLHCGLEAPPLTTGVATTARG